MAMQDDLVLFASLKQGIKTLTKELDKVEQRLVSAMDSKGQKSVSAQNGDVKGTLVTGSRMVIDEEKLKKSLTASQWRAVSKSVLDKEKLEASMVVGTVDPNTVAAATEEKDNKPYIRVTGKVTKDNPVAASVTLKNSQGHTKPAAKKRVRPAKPRS
jgi:hypothetical protein